MTTRAYAKINLDLRLGVRQADRFHPIETFFIRVDIFDTIHAEVTREAKCSLSILGDGQLSAGPDNLVLRAAHTLQQFGKTSSGVQLTLEKSIPQGAGLGGGSSDAASTLLLLRKLWSIPCSDAELATLGASLGSDVPFFLQPHAAHGCGRGEILHPVHCENLPWAVLIHPGFSSSTAEAYSAYAKSPQAGIEGAPLTLDLQGGKKLTLCPRNDLEAAVESKFLWIRTAREWISQQPGVMAARMSGSGSTVFGLWGSQQEAERVAAKGRAFFGSDTWIRSARLICGAK